ncbi:hypothetical protein AtNW77_Chr3g0173261 [Arabidopsis thaliana]
MIKRSFMSLCQSFRSHLLCALQFFLFRYLFLVSNNRNLWFIFYSLDICIPYSLSLFLVSYFFLFLLQYRSRKHTHPHNGTSTSLSLAHNTLSPPHINGRNLEKICI